MATLYINIQLNQRSQAQLIVNKYKSFQNEEISGVNYIEPVSDLTANVLPVQ